MAENYATIGIPGMLRKFGGPDFAIVKRPNSQIISSMIDSLITTARGGRPASTVVMGSICTENTMTHSEDNPPPAVGAYWIKEEDYQALLQLFDDGDKMPPSWQEWLKMAEEMEHGLMAYGHVVLRVYIDPATFPEWCAAHGTSPGSAGRRKFVAAAVTERYGRQA